MYKENVLLSETINALTDEVADRLRELSLKIHAYPEIAFQEKYAHDLLSDFMVEQGFQVTRGYLDMETAWRATFDHGGSPETRVIGINSEMDALPGIGHACGHNLIAVAGIAIAIILKTAMLQYGIKGSVVLLGTPAEESIGGKLILLERGAYKPMDICLMCHPSSGPKNSFSTGALPARQVITVEFKGKSAHSSNAPWEGRNALDAAFLAYSGLALLRQQMEPGTFSHGTIYGRDWTPNVIPDFATLTWMVRAPTIARLKALSERVINCFRGAATQTGCSVEIKGEAPWNDLKQNNVLATDFLENVKDFFGGNVSEGGFSASTDFGNVSQALPGLHAIYAIPTAAGGGNHTPEFANSARTEEAFRATMTCAKALAMTGLRILNNRKFYLEVKHSFEQSGKVADEEPDDPEIALQHSGSSSI